MQKADLFRQLAWAIVPHGTRTPRVEIVPGITAHVLVSGGAAVPPGESHAGLLESMFIGDADELPDEIDFSDAGHVDRVRTVVIGTFDLIRGSMTIRGAMAGVDDLQRTVLAKLDELAS